MKIIHYCGTFSKLSETFIYDVIVELENSGIDNKVVANRTMIQTERPFSKVIKLEVSTLNRVISFIKKCLNWFKVNKYIAAEELLNCRRDALHKVLINEKPDLIHAHFGAQGVAILPVAKRLGIPLIVSFHGYDAFRLPNEQGWKGKLSALFAEAGMVTVVSEMMYKQLISLGCPAAKLRLIHVGKRLNDYPFKLKDSHRIQKFISVGRLQDKKGFRDCIQAFQLLSQKYPGLSLKIIGTGSQEQELRRLIPDRDQQISFLGALSHEDTKKHIAASDAFILCSKTGADGDKEGIPVVLMEAMAMGLPCVSTKHSGIPEVIPDECHWLLAEEGNAADIAVKIEQLINSPASELAKLIELGRKKIEREFNLETEVAKLKTIYSAIING
jgi:colanic acid/amylovoran biosynthesis glycosyltransferase